MDDRDPENIYSCWIIDNPARRTAQVLRGPCSDEADALLAQGFMVPALEVLELAASRFEGLLNIEGPAAPGDTQALLNAWTSFVAHWRGLEDAIDLEWSTAWRRHVQSVRNDLKHARGIAASVGSELETRRWQQRAHRDYHDHQARNR